MVEAIPLEDNSTVVVVTGKMIEKRKRYTIYIKISVLYRRGDMFEL